MNMPVIKSEIKTEPYEGTHRFRLDYTVNIGILFHLGGLIIFLVGIMVTLSAWKATTEERLRFIEDRINVMEQINHQSQEILYQQNERLARIEGKIDEANDRRRSKEMQ